MCKCMCSFFFLLSTFRKWYQFILSFSSSIISILPGNISNISFPGFLLVFFFPPFKSFLFNTLYNIMIYILMSKKDKFPLSRQVECPTQLSHQSLIKILEPIGTE